MDEVVFNYVVYVIEFIPPNIIRSHSAAFSNIILIVEAELFFSVTEDDSGMRSVVYLVVGNACAYRFLKKDRRLIGEIILSEIVEAVVVNYETAGNQHIVVTAVTDDDSAAAHLFKLASCNVEVLTVGVDGELVTDTEEVARIDVDMVTLDEECVIVVDVLEAEANETELICVFFNICKIA